jgi:pilus assembly protein CpaD
MRTNHLPVVPRRGAARVLIAIGCAAMLTACNTTREYTGAVPDDLRQRHPIAIKEGVKTVELFIGSKRGGLTPAQRADVASFAGVWRREATGGILIDLPSGTANELAAANAVHEVRAMLSGSGVPPESVEVRAYKPADPRKVPTVRLNFPTMVAKAGPCGLWPEDLGPVAGRQHAENLEYYNLGCASQRNLAAMVENPADLVQPRGEVPPYNGRRTTVLDKYHRGEASSIQYPDKDQGKISDVGK